MQIEYYIFNNTINMQLEKLRFYTFSYTDVPCQHGTFLNLSASLREIGSESC